MSFLDSEPDGPEIPSSLRAQIDALNRLYGDIPSPEPALPRRATSGSSVKFKVTWSGQATKPQRKRLTDDEFAAYESLRMAAMVYVGTHERHFDTPIVEWTARDLKRLADDMVAVLLECPQRPAPQPWDHEHRYYLGVTIKRGREHGAESCAISLSGGCRDFRVEVTIAKAIPPLRALVEWLASLDPWLFTVTNEKRGLVTKASVHLDSDDDSESEEESERERPALDDRCDTEAIEEDDDEHDLSSRVILAAIRQSLYPAATWDEVKVGVRFLRWCIESARRGPNQ